MGIFTGWMKDQHPDVAAKLEAVAGDLDDFTGHMDRISEQAVSTAMVRAEKEATAAVRASKDKEEAFRKGQAAGTQAAAEAEARLEAYRAEAAALVKAAIIAEQFRWASALAPIHEGNAAASLAVTLLAETNLSPEKVQALAADMPAGRSIASQFDAVMSRNHALPAGADAEAVASAPSDPQNPTEEDRAQFRALLGVEPGKKLSPRSPLLTKDRSA